jgi:DNA polymerase-3 subunit alpha
MKDPAFIHLRLHTEFSISDSIIRIDEAIAKALEFGMPALGISDLMNLFGAIKFYSACQVAGIKPIVASDIWLENIIDRNQPNRLLLIVKNHEGYKRLCELLTKAHLQNQFQGRAEINPTWLEKEDNSGLICLSGAQNSDIAKLLKGGEYDKAVQQAKYWSQLFPQSFYLEIQRINAASEALLQSTLWLANQTHLPIVATHPIQFMQSDDFKAHEARVCITEGCKLEDKNRQQHFEICQYFLSIEEMQVRFADIDSALKNSVEIAKRCNLILPIGKNHLPNFAIPTDITIDDYLIQKARMGLIKRLEKLFPNKELRQTKQPIFEKRFELETGIIKQMGFSGYFLIVADLINWAKNNECPVGPGRGSGVGCLVSYCLGITEINPLDYGLLFERFLNVERMSTPDLDIDFCQENRYRVIEYVKHLYGKKAVSQIATFGKLASKAVIRDVGRVMALPYNFCDQLSKLIPFSTNKQYTLDEAVENEPILKERLANEEETSELWNLAKKLEGLTRNVSMHAGGVLIAPSPLTNFCPLYQGSGYDAAPVSMYDKNDIEKIGLVKFDFLGLRNLTIMELALRYIKISDPSFSQNLNTLQFNDVATYQTLQKANTTAVFQLESEGMKRLLEKLKPDRFEDIIAVLALHRPGPLGSGMIDDFILRKKGKQRINYFHDDLKGCLEPTYGVILYQEQVMQISQIIGGYTLEGADTLCRIMSKKKQEAMDQHRITFIEGAKQKKYPVKLAEQLFELMAKFAEYGFNKSHSTAYAVIAYQTAWLKTHYCAAFMAATMSLESHNTDQLKILYDDAKRNQLTFLPLDINESFYHFKPIDYVKIRYGLGAVKGVGEAATEKIIQERERNGSFTSLFDFCKRVDRQHLNKGAIEALICAGGFDAIEKNRAMLFHNIELCMNFGEQERLSAQQGKLFDRLDHTTSQISMKECNNWPEQKKLIKEKDALGFYLSGHPFSAYIEDARHFLDIKLSDITPQNEAKWLGGFVTHIRTKISSKGKMAFVQLEDLSAKVNIVVYAETWEKFCKKIQEDKPLIVKAKISADDFSNGIRIIAEEFFSMNEARNHFAHFLKLNLSSYTNVNNLKKILAAASDPQNGCAIEVAIQTKEAKGEYRLGKNWQVQLSDQLLESLYTELGHDSVSIVWQ